MLSSFFHHTAEQKPPKQSEHEPDKRIEYIVIRGLSAKPVNSRMKPLLFGLPVLPHREGHAAVQWWKNRHLLILIVACSSLAWAISLNSRFFRFKLIHSFLYPGHFVLHHLHLFS
jgi:hypothetical protein